MKFYKVLVGGRNCLKRRDGFLLKEGDILVESGTFMLKLSDGKNPTQNTCMFIREPMWDEHKGWYKEVSISEIKHLIPHLHKNKFYCHSDVKSYVLKQIQK